MCRIVGYVGNRERKSLEDQGCDSAGLAVLNGDGLPVRLATGTSC